MEPFRVLHTADLHLATPFRGLSNRLPEFWVKQVRAASDDVFERIVDTAIREQVQVVTIAGDLFDTGTAGMAAVFALRRGFARLKEADIPVFCSHGNHDPLMRNVPVDWPDNVHVFPALDLATDTPISDALITLPGGTRVQIAGFSYPETELRHNVAGRFVRRPDADFAIALLHGAVGPVGDHDNYAPAALSDLTARGFDVWGLGHIHQPAILQSSQPLILYPGNPQGRHPNEEGLRGVRIIDVDAHGQVDSRFVLTAAVIWTHCEVSLTGADTVSQAVSALTTGIEQTLPADGVQSIVRLRLSGRTRLHAELAKQDDFLDELLQDVMSRLPAVWVERCEVATRPELNLEVLANSYEFVGEFLRLVEDYRTSPEALRSLVAPVLADLFHEGNELPLDAVHDQQLLAWLDEALAQFLQFADDGGAE